MSTAKTSAQRARAYRVRQRGGEPRQPAPCGTRAAAVRHRRHSEPLCDACREAERAYGRQAQQRSRNTRHKENTQ